VSRTPGAPRSASCTTCPTATRTGRSPSSPTAGPGTASDDAVAGSMPSLRQMSAVNLGA